MSQDLPRHLIADLRSVVDDNERRSRWLRDVLSAEGGRLWRHCRALSPSDADADDLLNDTLLKALQKPPKDRDASVLPWLKAVARNLAIDKHRARREIAAPDLEQEGADVDDHAARAAVDRALVEAIASLSVAQLAAFLLKTLLDLSAEEVAEIVGSSPGAVRVGLHRARARLLEAVEAPRREAVSDFLEHICAGQLSGLDDLLRATAHPESISQLLGPAPRRAWERLIEAAGALFSREATESAAMLAWSRAAALQRNGDLTGSDAAYQEALALSKERGLEGLAARALIGLAFNAMHRGDDEEIAEVRSALGIPPEDADPEGSLTQLFASGQLWRRGDYREAQARYLELLQREDEPHKSAALLHNAALVGSYQGDLEVAWERGVAALEGFVRLGRQEEVGTAMNTLGMIAQNRGDLREAASWFQRSLQQHQRYSPELAALKPTINLGLIAHEQGDFSEARTLFLRVIERAEALDVDRTLAIALANLGVTEHASGRPRRALPLFSRAAALLSDPSEPLRLFIDSHEAAARGGEPASAQRAVEILTARGDLGLAAACGALLAWCRLCAGEIAMPELEAALEVARGEVARSSAARIAADLVRRRAVSPARAR